MSTASRALIRRPLGRQLKRRPSLRRACLYRLAAPGETTTLARRVKSRILANPSSLLRQDDCHAERGKTI
jgi:hypothetical protein